MVKKKLEKAKEKVKLSCCFKMYNPGQQNTFVRLFFFEVLTIIQIFLRGLGKLNFDSFTWLGIEFLNIVETLVGKIL